MMMKPPHPGETLQEEYLVPLGVSINALAEELGIGAARLNDIVRRRRGVTADTALRLARYFGTTPELWLNLQAFYELRMAQRKVGRTIERTVKPRQAACSPSGRLQSARYAGGLASTRSEPQVPHQEAGS